MKIFDYIYFSLLKRSIKNWKVANYDSADAKASLINGVLYLLLYYNICKVLGVDFTNLNGKTSKWLFFVEAVIVLLPLIIYSFGGRARLIGKYRDRVGGGGWIMLVFYALILSTVFVWNMDIVKEMLFGEGSSE